MWPGVQRVYSLQSGQPSARPPPSLTLADSLRVTSSPQAPLEVKVLRERTTVSFHTRVLLDLLHGCRTQHSSVLYGLVSQEQRAAHSA